MDATIYERGNGFPEVGDYVIAGDDGTELFRIVALGSNIDTRSAWGNSIWAEIESADWDDCPAGAEFPCRVEITAPA